LVRLSIRLRVVSAVCALIAAIACGGGESAGPSQPSPVVNPRLTAPVADGPAADEQLDTLRPTLTVRNGTSDQAGARTYEFQISDTADFSSALTSYITSYNVTVLKTGVPEGTDGRTSFTPDSDLQPTTRFYWRARMTQGATVSEWSPAGKFRSKLVGFIRDGALFDPLIHGESVGEPIGQTTFVPGKGVRLENGLSYVRYRLPRTIGIGEFSMDVEGLRANAPGDKSKVFGMQEGTSDFITNDYRIDIQYRGVNGAPPNAIQWRVIYGDADDLDVRYEPDSAKRFASVFLLNPSTTYHWRFTWGPDIRLVMREGGINGNTLYDYGLAAHDGTYNPNPHIAYLGAPVGRSGNEAASIPGTVYRNVWLGDRPRPESLGSALWVGQ
jgi:hypothetical protein